MKIIMFKFKVFLFLFLFCNFNLNAWQINSIVNNTEKKVFLQFFYGDTSGLSEIIPKYYCYIDPNSAFEVNLACPREVEKGFEHLVHIASEKVLVSDYLWITLFDEKNGPLPEHFIFCEGMMIKNSIFTWILDKQFGYVFPGTFFCRKGFGSSRELHELFSFFLELLMSDNRSILGYWQISNSKNGDLIISKDEEQNTFFTVEWQEEVSRNGEKHNSGHGEKHKK